MHVITSCLQLLEGDIQRVITSHAMNVLHLSTHFAVLASAQRIASVHHALHAGLFTAPASDCRIC